MGAKIAAIEYVLGKNKVTNDDLLKEFPNYDFKGFEAKVGIKSRYIVDAGQTGLDLAVEACEKLFRYIDKNSVDYILYCTQSPDFLLPTTACILQDKLGLKKNIGALDFNLGCSGYTYGLGLAKSLINAKQASCVLFITAETYSKYLHPKDRSNRAIFGDAAACTLIVMEEEEYIHDFCYGTDGSGYNKLIVKNGGARNAYLLEAQEIEYGSENVFTDNHFYMNGPEVFNFTSDIVPGFTHEVAHKNCMEIGEVDQFILHQANSFMLNFIRKKLRIDPAKFYIDLAETGNTVSCTIPIALKKYSQKLLVNQRQNIILIGFGVGLSWCGGMISINKAF